jgi:hypothetical protein
MERLGPEQGKETTQLTPLVRALIDVKSSTNLARFYHVSPFFVGRHLILR